MSTPDSPVFYRRKYFHCGAPLLNYEVGCAKWDDFKYLDIPAEDECIPEMLGTSISVGCKIMAEFAEGYLMRL